MVLNYILVGCPWAIEGKSSLERFPVPTNTAARKIGNGVIPSLWQLGRHWNPYHNKFSSPSNTTVLTPGNFSKSLFILKRRRYWPWITAPSHKCNNKLDCFFAGNVANYGQFFHKIKFARTFKKCFLSARFGSRKYFFYHYWETTDFYFFFFNSDIWRYFFFLYL